MAEFVGTQDKNGKTKVEELSSVIALDRDRIHPLVDLRNECAQAFEKESTWEAFYQHRYAFQCLSEWFTSPSLRHAAVVSSDRS